MVHVLNAAAFITNFGFHWSEKKMGSTKMEPETFRLEVLSFFFPCTRETKKKQTNKSKNKNKIKQNRQNKTNVELFLLIQFQRRHIPIVLLLS